MIVVSNLSKQYDGKFLFEQLDLTIQDGEFITFSGPSGSGKTTLLNILGGLERPDTGEVIINGRSITSLHNKSTLFATEIGFLFQNFVLMETKTVYQNLNLIKKKFRSDISIQEALDQVGLKDKINTAVYKLSGGEQQRVALARLIVKKCTIIFADEPTGSLDKINGDKVVSILLELHKTGKTIVLVTHDDQLKNKSQRIISL